ncbi:hypothetical protein EYF80_047498 [Liparis tanakae]|uniref:Uncharacterized protein n=1 Tax=Liparis tanakae TaxID=230148 RepID=A0A4Z2FM64_9TELE|nr:hypothetical protein EYF80_047498 [Liparis tanakae]
MQSQIHHTAPLRLSWDGAESHSVDGYLSLRGVQGSPAVGSELVELIKLEAYVLDRQLEHIPKTSQVLFTQLPELLELLGDQQLSTSYGAPHLPEDCEQRAKSLEPDRGSGGGRMDGSKPTSS